MRLSIHKTEINTNHKLLWNAYIYHHKISHIAFLNIRYVFSSLNPEFRFVTVIILCIIEQITYDKNHFVL